MNEGGRKKKKEGRRKLVVKASGNTAEYVLSEPSEDWKC
jgi:hypothetical protein